MTGSGRVTSAKQDPDTVVLGVKDSTSYNDQFGDVTIKTKEGDYYVFPMMNITKLQKILPENGRIPEGMQCLVLVNASFASLSIPFRIVRYICTPEVGVLWSSTDGPGSSTE
jgi:hypothetical protein